MGTWRHAVVLGCALAAASCNKGPPPMGPLPPIEPLPPDAPWRFSTRAGADNKNYSTVTTLNSAGEFSSGPMNNAPCEDGKLPKPPVLYVIPEVRMDRLNAAVREAHPEAWDTLGALFRHGKPPPDKGEQSPEHRMHSRSQFCFEGAPDAGPDRCFILGDDPFSRFKDDPTPLVAGDPRASYLRLLKAVDEAVNPGPEAGK